jgi:hypothetical protein
VQHWHTFVANVITMTRELQKLLRIVSKSDSIEHETSKLIKYYCYFCCNKYWPDMADALFVSCIRHFLIHELYWVMYIYQDDSLTSAAASSFFFNAAKRARSAGSSNSRIPTSSVSSYMRPNCFIMNSPHTKGG